MELVEHVKTLFHNNDNKNLLMMSSGNFDGIDFATLANEIITD